MRNKQKGNPLIKLLVTMRLAWTLDCSYEDAQKVFKSMVKAKPNERA
jgi:hypothetical protein